VPTQSPKGWLLALSHVQPALQEKLGWQQSSDRAPQGKHEPSWQMPLGPSLASGLGYLQDTPFGRFPAGTHVAFAVAVVHAVLPNVHGSSLSLVQSTSGLHEATHFPELQTLLPPQGEPSDLG
jgi:hypothetical protein